MDFAEQHAPNVQATVAKPGPINGPNRAVSTFTFSPFGDVPSLHVSELAAAMIDQCVNGITKDPLWPDDLLEIGQRVLSKENYVQ